MSFFRASGTYGDMPPREQETTPKITCDSLVCSAAVIVAVVVCFVAWLSLIPHGPRFTVTSLFISGGQVAFNVSASNPNRHVGINYEGATWASILFHDTLVASGPASPAGWCQPGMNTTSIAGVLHVIDHSLSAALRAGRLPLRLQLTTAPISFTRDVFTFPSIQKSMHVSCYLLVGTDGNLLRESVGAACDTYFGLGDDDYDYY